MSVRFEDLVPGIEIPTLEKVVTRIDVKAYAEASGDRNPLHHDDAVARAAGFPGIVAHGMFTMGHVASCVVRWIGDPARLQSLRVQFRSPVFMGETIVAGGSVRSLDEVHRTAELDVWVRLERNGRTEWPIRRSTAVVRID